MKVLKKIFIDLLVTIIIILSLFVHPPYIKYFLYIYTPLILIGRIVALTGLNIQKKMSGKAPDWFFHILYAINVLVLAWNRWWILCGLWLVIWILAFIYVSRPKTKKRQMRRL